MIPETSKDNQRLLKESQSVTGKGGDSFSHHTVNRFLLSGSRAEQVLEGSSGREYLKDPRVIYLNSSRPGLI